MTIPTVLKRTYDAVALFALFNLIFWGGVAAYLVGSGVLDGSTLQRFAAVLRDEDQPPPDAAPKPTETEDEEPAREPVTTSSGDTQVELEIIRREADRIKEELRQRLALSNTIMLRITTARENFQRELEMAEQTAKARRQQSETEGFEKQIAILAGVKAKTAVEHLLGLGDPDEAARILLAMDTRKAKKIVEAAKRPDQMQQMQSILRRLREVAPDRSSELSLGS